MTEKKLTSDDKPKFIKQFIETIDGMSNEEIAEMVWNYGNDQWSSGYNRGYYNPDYTDDSIDD